MNTIFRLVNLNGRDLGRPRRRCVYNIRMRVCGPDASGSG
jgi:hypothetical protein